MVNHMWNYESIGLFFQKYYERLLTSSQIDGREMFIEEFKDEHGIPTSPNEKFLFPFKKEGFVYLVPSEYKDKFPIMVKNYQRMSYSGKGYRLVTNLKPMKIMPEKTMEFRELVNKFAKLPHTNKTHDLLWRLISIVSFIDRINVRIATNPEFGKDSKINIIGSLTGEIGKISNPTIAKLEYLLNNKVCFINEVAGINSTSKQDIEQFILQCGDFNNVYNKRSRAGAGSSEKYDISKMSLIIAYNDLGQYNDDKKFFDFMWTNGGAIKNRILPLLLNGKIQADFNTPFDAEEVVKKNWYDYIKFMRALLYFRYNNVNSLKWDTPKFSFSSDRWERNFIIIAKWLAEYSKTQQEYDELLKELYKAHASYQKMIGHGDNSGASDSDLSSSNPLEESIGNADRDRVLLYIGKFDKGTGIDIGTILVACSVEEDLLKEMSAKADIYEIKPGRYSRLD